MTGARRILIRDVAQVATPAGAAAPLRGASLGALELVEDAFVLLHGERDRGRRPRCASCRGWRGRSRSSTAGASPSCPGSSTATRTPRSPATGRTSSRCGHAGRAYEELLAAGGGILSTTRATRAAGPDELEQIVVRHRDAMLAHGTTTFEGKSGYGLDHDTELAQLAAIAAAGGVPTWLGAHAVPPEHPDADAYVDWAIRGGPPGRGADRRRRRTCSSSAGRSTSSRPGATSRPVDGPGSACGSTATSSTRSARSGWRSSSARARSTTSRPRARRASRRWPRATSSACCSRSPRSTWTARCLPAARSSTRARRSRSRRTSTPGAPTARAFRSSARSPARSSGSLPRRRSPRAP